MMSLERKIFQYIDRLTPTYLDLIKELIRIPSLTGREANCQRRIREVMQYLDIFYDQVFAANHSPYTETGRDYGGRPCLIGRLSGRGDGRHFVLNAHIDTAPVENSRSWTHPPYEPVMIGNRLYGRGALDDKAGVAMMLMLADCMQRADACFPGDIYWQSVIEDEDSGNGTRACLEAGYYCEAGIIIDGTWPLRIVDAHLGQIWITGAITGLASPACSTYRAVNPIRIFTSLIKDLDRDLLDKKNETGPWLDIESPFFICPGVVRSGIWPGAVPETCRFKLQIGFPPPYLPESIFRDVKAKAARLEEKYPGSRIELQAGPLFTPPFSHRMNAMTRLIKATAEDHLGKTVVVQSALGHCDLRYLRKKDGAPADACLYGPGGGGNPHTRDEYYLVDHFAPVAKNIAASLIRYYDA